MRSYADIIALTANLTAFMAEAYRSGFQAWLSRPLSLARWMAVLTVCRDHGTTAWGGGSTYAGVHLRRESDLRGHAVATE